MIVGVIPARYASTRLPFKLVRKLYNKPIIQWTWESASKAKFLDKLIVACDDKRIEEIVKGFGGTAMLTSSQHSSGTDRVAEAVRDIDADIVVNIQADEPLIHSAVIDSLVQEMMNNKKLVMATVRKRIDDENEINNPSVTKVICDKDNFAVYFSRFSLPYYRDKYAHKLYYKHMGIYAYTKDFLYTFKNLPQSYLEEAEKLEQLRAIESGYKIKVIESQFESWGVDTEEDLVKVEKILAERGYA
jgi:3-deoxy-manno-octulosonate cytidylyltransferase (CMP-KDO synthetase)